MTISRRSFVSRSSVWLAGSVLLPCSVLAVTPRVRTFSVAVPLSAADETVLTWVRSYASDVRLTGSGLLGKLRQSAQAKTHILAKVNDTAVLDAALAAPLPFGGATVYAHGNTFIVKYAGTEFTIENLLPAAFDAALAARVSRSTTTFATDGLTWDPSTTALADPFSAAAGSSLKLVNPGLGVPAVFATMLNSFFEADTANVKFDASFQAYWRRVMALSGAGRGVAEAVVKELIARLPELADTRTEREVSSIITTPIVTFSLRRQLGLDAHAVVTQFTALRAQTPAAISDAGIWLALLLAPQLRLGTAGVFAGGLAPEKQARFLAALAEANQIA